MCAKYGGGGNKSVEFVNHGRVSAYETPSHEYLFFERFPFIFQDDPTFVLKIPQNDWGGGGAI